MHILVETYNLYKTHDSTIDKKQTKSKEIANKQNDIVKRITVYKRLSTKILRM